MRRSVIVCAIDASTGTRHAVAQAGVLARVRKQELHLLRAADGEAGRKPEAGAEALPPTIAEALRSTLGSGRGREAVRFRICATRGRPEKAILDHARRSHAALIVIPATYGGDGASAGAP